MSLFGINYSKEGPGVSPDEPRKKGLARLFEVLGRDLWSFYRAGLLALIGLIPYIFGMVLAIDTHAILVLLLASILGGVIAGPGLCGLADTILRSLRDEPNYWWATYRKAFKRNWKASLLPGGVCGLVFGVQLFTLFHMGTAGGGTVTWVMLFVSILLALGLMVYIWPQVALLEMPFGGILKNSALLFLGYLPRSGGALLIWAVYLVAVVLFFPVSLLLLVLINLWIAAVPALLVLYPALEKSFNIEATVKELHEAALRRDGGE